MVVKVTTMQNQKPTISILPKSTVSETFDFGKKLISQREGSSMVQIWLGAIQGPMVIASLIRTLDRKGKIHDSAPLLFSVEFVEYLLTECERHDLAFIAIAQLINDTKSGAASLVDIDPDEEPQSSAAVRPRTTYQSSQITSSPIDICISKQAGYRYIVVNGLSPELLTLEHRATCNAELSRMVEIIDERNGTSFLHHIDWDNITYQADHQHVDYEDMSATVSVYIPLFDNAEAAIWAHSRGAGVEREPLASELHGIGSRSVLAGKVDRVRVSTGYTRSGKAREDTDFAPRIMTYAYSLVHKKGNSFFHGGEIFGGTWLDIDAVASQVEHWLTTLGYVSFFVLCRVLRLKHKGAGRNPDRFYSHPVLSIYFETEPLVWAFRSVIGLMGRTPIASPSSRSSSSATVSWSLVTKQGQQAKDAKDFLRVPVQLGLKVVVVARKAADFKDMKLLETMRAFGVIIGPLDGTKIDDIERVVLHSSNITKGLQPTTMFLGPTMLGSDHIPGACELVIVQDPSRPLPDELICQVDELSHCRHSCVSVLSRTPFKGSIRLDRSALGLDYGTTHPDGTLIELSVSMRITRGPRWRNFVNLDLSESASEEDEDMQGSPAKIFTAPKVIVDKSMATEMTGSTTLGAPSGGPAATQALPATHNETIPPLGHAGNILPTQSLIYNPYPSYAQPIGSRVPPPLHKGPRSTPETDMHVDPPPSDTDNVSLSPGKRERSELESYTSPTSSNKRSGKGKGKGKGSQPPPNVG